MFRKYKKEIFYQLSLIIVVFLAITFDKDHPHIHEFEVFYFLNYLSAVFVINYWLLPVYFYAKKYIKFTLFTFLVLGCVMLVEELILEKVYFPDTMGNSFPGVFNTLIEIVPVILLFVGLKFAWDAQIKQSQVDKLNQKMVEDQLKFLNSQINPHFLFNNLNNIYSYALDNSPKTPEIILGLSSVLRYMLYDCKEKNVALNLELEKLEDFLKIQELQFEDRGRINYSVKGDSNNKYIAPLILIVFIENAFKHSSSSLSDNIKIDIHVNIEGDNLHLFCTNNFQEKEEKLSMPKGIGLENVKMRLELLYPNTHTLKINNLDGVFSVDLMLKLKKLV